MTSRPKPDPFSATVRMGTRWRNGSLWTLDDHPLPEIQDGSLIELILPALAITNVKERQKLVSRCTLDLLPAKSTVFLGLSHQCVPAEIQVGFMQLQKAAPVGGYLLSEVVVMEPLRLALDGSQRATLEPCRCRVSLLNEEAKSLNHALTLLSLSFELERMSHSGNVFRQGFIRQNSRWQSLDDLRDTKVAEFLYRGDPGRANPDKSGEKK